jgi:peptidoglycan biosynthesis protein MviN/MurJ (putative lipid II flippase)
MGHVGISAAVAGSSAVQMALLFVALKRKLGTLRSWEVGRSVGRTLVASAVAAVVGWEVARALEPLASGDVTRLLPGGLGSLAFGLAFLLAARLLGSEELRLLVGGVRRRVARRR